MQTGTLTLALGLALGACRSELPSPHLLTRPRVLAIVADPPHVHPGDTMELRAALESLDASVQLTWHVCPAPAVVELWRGGADAGIPLEQACFRERLPTLMVTTSSAHSARVTIPADALTREDWRAQIVTLNSRMVLHLAVEVSRDGVVVDRILQRSSITTGTLPTRTEIGTLRLGTSGLEITRTTDAEMLCRAPTGMPLSIRRNTSTTLPTTTISASTNSPVTTRWFATDGRFGTVAMPTSDTEWLSPSHTGNVRFWLVAGQDTVGYDACHFELLVVE